MDEICEFLFATATHEDSSGLVRFTAQGDHATGVVYTSMLVGHSSLPRDLHERVTVEVERQVRAFFADLGVVCKAVEDPRFGRCFELDLPGEQRVRSWDEFRNRRPLP